MFKRILVPTDGSELSGRAIATAITLAKTVGAEIFTLCVKEPFPYGAVELTELELYLAQRAAGMKIDTPAVRP